MKKTSELLISVIEKNFTKYQLIEKIGEGVSSVVYSAYFTDANSIVTKKALKIINLSSRNSKRNYQREIKAHSILQTHESILSINDHMVFKHKGIQYGVLEFDLMDVDLMDVILRKNQSGNNTVNKKKHKENNLLCKENIKMIFKQVCRAVLFCQIISLTLILKQIIFSLIHQIIL